MIGDSSARDAAEPAADDEAYCASCGGSFAPELTVCPTDGARLVRFAAKRDALIGQVLDGRYEIRSALGEGGMGTVYRGWQLSVDREVAIKVVHPTIANEREAAKRFLREARVSSRLNAPGIVNVYDFGQSDGGVLFLVMELLKGQSLADIQQAGPLPVRRVLNIGLQLCDALETAHTQGIVHRDLKPGNIMILSDPPGRDALKVLDFGLAKATSSDVSAITNAHVMLGTPLYMAPEQIEGADVDNRTDLYALGVILFELLTGASPFDDTSLQGIFAKHLTHDVPELPHTVHPVLADAVKRLLAKSADARFASAAELRDTLLRVQHLLGTPPAGMPAISASLSMALPTHGSAPMPVAAVPSNPALPVAPTVAAPVDRPRKRSFAIVAGTVVTLLAGGGLALGLMSKDADAPAVTPAPAPAAIEEPPRTTPPTDQPARTADPAPRDTSASPPPVEPTPAPGSAAPAGDAGATVPTESDAGSGTITQDKAAPRDKKRDKKAKRDKATKPGTTDLDFLK